MKSLVLVFTMLLSLNAFGIIANSFSSDRTNTGTVNYQDNIFVRIYSATGSIAAGQVVVVDTSESADNGMYATTTTSVYKKPLCVAAEAIAEGASGKCQVYGVGSVTYAPGSSTVATPGEPAYMDNNTAGSVRAVGAVVAKTDPAFLHDVGVFMDHSSATANVPVFINLL